jgi:YebC/PmpR family DNA-binding regulatory protein
MSGHNKWSKIKRKKGAEDAKKSQIFSRYSKFITNESKKCNGDVNSPGLATAIEAAKKENMTKEAIDRAVKKGTDKDTGVLEAITYETYGPGGVALVIDVLTDNKNRTGPELRHLLVKLGYELATPGAALWAFTRQNGEWIPNVTVAISEEDQEKLGDLFDTIEEHDDVQGVYTNAE